MEPGIKVICEDGNPRNAVIETHEGAKVENITAIDISLKHNKLATAVVEFCLVGMVIEICQKDVKVANLDKLNKELACLGYEVVKLTEQGVLQ